MNYHLMVDEKFIDCFIATAEQVSPNNNRYIFTFDRPAKYVESNKGLYAPYGSSELTNVINGITLNDRVFVHWFNSNVMQVIGKIDPRIPVYLLFWGGDFVEQSNEFQNFNFDPLTKRYVRRNELYDQILKLTSPSGYINLIANFVIRRHKREKVNNEFQIRKQFLKRLNYFCHWNPLDYDMIRQAYGCAPDFMNFFYGMKLNTHGDRFKDKKNNKNETVIWLGNSDTETNNHLDAIHALSTYKDERIEIICPLSYGNNRYGNYIARLGSRVFRGRWKSLRDFMPVEQYLKLSKNADVIVMYHNRTQAAFNIFSFLLMGKKVYIKKQSTIYQLMKNNGVVVFDANTIKGTNFEEFSRPLNTRQIKSNIKKVSSLFSKKKELDYMDKLLN